MWTMNRLWWRPCTYVVSMFSHGWSPYGFDSIYPIWYVLSNLARNRSPWRPAQKLIDSSWNQKITSMELICFSQDDPEEAKTPVEAIVVAFPQTSQPNLCDPQDATALPGESSKQEPFRQTKLKLYWSDNSALFVWVQSKTLLVVVPAGKSSTCPQSGGLRYTTSCTTPSNKITGLDSKSKSWCPKFVRRILCRTKWTRLIFQCVELKS